MITSFLNLSMYSQRIKIEKNTHSKTTWTCQTFAMNVVQTKLGSEFWAGVIIHKAYCYLFILAYGRVVRPQSPGWRFDRGAIWYQEKEKQKGKENTDVLKMLECSIHFRFLLWIVSCVVLKLGNSRPLHACWGIMGKHVAKYSVYMGIQFQIISVKIEFFNICEFKSYDTRKKNLSIKFEECSYFRKRAIIFFPYICK